jgi:hypothetical protein
MVDRSQDRGPHEEPLQVAREVPDYFFGQVVVHDPACSAQIGYELA